MINETACQRNKAVPLTACLSWDETVAVWQRNKAMSLTNCWSWDETWLMRLAGKELNKAVLLTACWSWDETGWQRHIESSVTHCLLVMGCETWLTRLPGNETLIKQCHSLPVCHGMRHDWWECLARNAAVSLTCCWLWPVRWDMIHETGWQRNKAVSLASCSSWLWDETWDSDCLAKKICGATAHSLLHWICVSEMAWKYVQWHYFLFSM